MRSKKRFIPAILVAMAAVLVLWSAPASADPVKLSYANFPPAITFPCVQMERWKTEVEKQTNGKVLIETYPGGTLLGAKNMLSGVMQGQADIGCLCMSYQPGVFPLTTVLGVPVGFTKSTVASMTLWDLWEKYQPKEFSGVKVLALFTTAPSNIMSKVPVRSLADLKGLELRASGGASKVLSMLGAVPVSMPMPETPDALQKGMVKGLLSSLEVLKDFNFAEYCRYETLTNFQVYPFAVVMNKDKWNALPSDVKTVFDGLRVEQSLWTGEYMDGHVQESLAWSKEKYQIEVISLPESEQAQALETLSGMVDEWKKNAAKSGVPTEAVFNDMLSLKAKYEKQYGR
ncbi:MAG: TRAP transporter substrate-binding protein [Thermodesulfobacteriota bacterium]|nr:TRAP transporter substrate-binding protein [Thermodesulfobacteriota bacterium]